MNAKMLRILNNREQNYPHALEDQFPRIFNKIIEIWDRPEIDAYFTQLMVSDRLNRQGFAKEVASDIVYLTMVHARQQEPDNEISPWDGVSDILKNQIELQGGGFFQERVHFCCGIGE